MAEQHREIHVGILQSTRFRLVNFRSVHTGGTQRSHIVAGVWNVKTFAQAI